MRRTDSPRTTSVSSSPEPYGAGINDGGREEVSDRELALDELRTRLVEAQRLHDGAEDLLRALEQQAATLEPDAPDEQAALRREIRKEYEASADKIEEIEMQLQAIEMPPMNGFSKRPFLVPGRSSEQWHEGELYDDAAITQRPHAIRLLESLVSPDLDDGLPSTIEALGMINRLLLPPVGLRLAAHLPEQLVLEAMLPLLAADQAKDIRSMAYRTLTRLAPALNLAQPLLDVHLIRTFARDHRHDTEKQHALGLVRARMTEVGFGVLRAVVALAESGEDRLRNVALETLAELVIKAPDRLIRVDGLRVVLQALADGPSELAPSLAALVLYIADRPQLREHLRPGLDLEIVLAGITDTLQKGSSSEERMRTSGKVFTILLRSWPGLLYLCCDEKRAIKSVIGSLLAPSRHMREVLFDTLFDVFRIRKPPWFDEYLSGKRVTMFRRSKFVSAADILAADEDGTRASPAQGQTTLADHYLGIVLLVFVDCGLMTTLTQVAEDASLGAVSRKASLLIGELLQLANRVLPLETSSRLQTLPRLFKLASAFGDGLPRLAATSALQSVDSLSRNRSKLVGSAPDPIVDSTGRPRANSSEDPLRRGQRQVETARVKLGMSIDDNTFRTLLLDTQVLVSSKDHTKWNTDALLTIFEGPLLNPLRLDEAIKGSKFCKRVVQFFLPSELRYSVLPNTIENVTWTRIACLMLTTLVASPEGAKFLQQEKLIKQIADALQQIDPVMSKEAKDPFFERDYLTKTMRHGYIDMICTLTRSAEGLRLLEHFKIFTHLYHITDLKHREDITRMLIADMDYSFDGHARLILAKELVSPYKHLRQLALLRLADLIQSSSGSARSQEWMIQLLVPAIYDVEAEIVQLAVDLLEAVCDNLEALEIVVKLRPILAHLGDRAAPLRLRFLSAPVGVAYLASIGYIDRELDHWWDFGNDAYVYELEVRIAHFFNTSPSDPVDSSVPEAISGFDGTIPPHFYGELVKTAEGRAIFETKGHYEELVRYLHDFGLEDRDAVNLAKLKAALWAIGSIGSTDFGLPLLEMRGAVTSMVEIATRSLCPSIRGTSCFALGLIAKTREGADMLEELGWDVVFSPLGLPLALTVPHELDAFVQLPTWSPSPSNEDRALHPPKSRASREIMDAIANLSNHLLANNASKTLAKVRGGAKSNATSALTGFPTTTVKLPNHVELFARALHMLEHQHFRLPVRRYIMDFFEDPMTFESVHSVVTTLQDLREARQRPPNSPLEPLSNHSSGGLNLPLRGAQRKRALTDDFAEDMTSEDEDDGDDTKANPPEVLEPRLTITGFLL